MNRAGDPDVQQADIFGDEFFACLLAVQRGGLGGQIEIMSPEQFAQMNRSEYERYGRLVREAGIKGDSN